MKVKIIKVSVLDAWYAEYYGKIIEVKKSYQNFDGNPEGNDSHPHYYFSTQREQPIPKTDCLVVPDKDPGITREAALDLVASVESMLATERAHLEYLESNQNKVSRVLNINTMIATSKRHIEHFELRIKQYKAAWKL